jgi:hypothetical protein
MNVVIAPIVALLLSLLVCASACGDAGKTAPQRGEVGAERDAKAGADGELAADAKVGTNAKVGADGKSGSVADAVADTKAVAGAKAGADAKAPTEATADPDAKAVDPKAPAKPGVDPSALYWASTSETVVRSTIDLIDLPDGEMIMALAEAHEHPDGINATLPKTAKLPAGFAVGDEWVVATTVGERRGKAVAFGATGGASEVQFVVVIDAAGTGLAARASAWTGPIPTLRAPKVIDLAKDERGKELFRRLEPAIVAATDPSALAALKGKRLVAEHLTVVEGRFPNGSTYLVSLTRPVADEEEFDSDHVAGLLLADATGRIEAIAVPGMTFDSYEVHYLVDLEGDGIDEVVYDSSYYEGSYRVLITWDAAGKPVQRTLGGDGA